MVQVSFASFTFMIYCKSFSFALVPRMSGHFISIFLIKHNLYPFRAPELLFGAKQYSTAIDMWSLGCIMAELLSKEPLFNGKNEFDQLDKVNTY